MDFGDTKVCVFVLLFVELRLAVVLRDTDQLSPKATLRAAAFGLEGDVPLQHKKVTPPTRDAGEPTSPTKVPLGLRACARVY